MHAKQISMMFKFFATSRNANFSNNYMSSLPKMLALPYDLSHFPDFEEVWVIFLTLKFSAFSNITGCKPRKLEKGMD